ncbi:hypothetical protein F5Y14DRAFT_48711 [Nemania sp. NC0429]|nr:hypothetical protein F5Y14DRAFT_48711 [Nemania sp. NC0429]
MESLNDARPRIARQPLEQASSQHVQPPSSRQRPPVKITRVFPPIQDEGDIGNEIDAVDIFAVHGLDTKSPDTWIWKDNPKDPQGPGVNWLADKHMLPSRVGHSRIFTCDWPAELFETRDFAEHTFGELARLLLDSILGCHKKDRPILFIASCLGGIILMKALDMATGRYDCVGVDTRAIIFLATPFGTTAYQEVTKWAWPGLKAWAWSQDRRVTQRLDFAKELVPELEELVRKFTQMIKKRDYEVSTLYEKRFTNLHRKVPLLGRIWPRRRLLVDEKSGMLQCDGSPLSLDRTHVLMNKFPGPKDEDYKRVASRVELCLQRVRDGTPLQRADARILKYYTKGTLDIVRLSGDVLNMDQCYINLAIVKQLPEASQTSPFSLPSRLNIETPDQEGSIELPTLFSSQEDPQEHTKGPRRILIRGRAGVGKTTLCKKIVYNFYYEKMWEHLFARVLWIPLRELKKTSYTKDGLGELFWHIYFKEHVDGKTLAKALWEAVERTDQGDSLFILDGLDEVTELLDPGHEAYHLLESLLRKPNVIITSRPHAQFPSNTEKPPLELETIGFYPDQVHTYVKTVVQDTENAEEIWSFLQKFELIQSLVRIPIQLDALCQTWDEGFRNQPVPETMTAIYQAIVKGLWKKDAQRFGKLKGPSAKMAFDAEIEAQMEVEIKILENLGFSGMHNNVVEFRPEHRDGIRELVKPSKDDDVFDERLGKLSFLRSSEPLASIRQRSYHFLHLTFQEFFAARYFARQWQAGDDLEYQDFKTKQPSKINPHAFLKQEKYTGRYNIFWRFTAGLLPCDKVPDFFKAIDQEPVDLVGLTHHQLVMHCFGEATISERKILSGLELRSAQWLLADCDWGKGRCILANDWELPAAVLLSALETSSIYQRPGVIRSFREHGKHMSEAVATALVEIIKGSAHNHGDKVARLAAEALSYQPKFAEAAIIELSNTYNRQSCSWLTTTETGALVKHSNPSSPAVKAVVGLFAAEHTKLYAEYIATDALRGRRSLSAATITTCVELVQYDNSLQQMLADALWCQKNIPTAAVLSIVKFIEHECCSGKVRHALVGALRSQAIRPEAVITAIVKVIENDFSDEYTRCDMVSALRGAPDLPETAITALVSIIEDESKGRELRIEAVSSLGFPRNLSEATITALVRLIGDTRKNMETWGFYHMFLPQESLSETTAAVLVRLLEDSHNSEEVRLTAADLIMGKATLSEENIMALARLIEDDRNSEKVRLAAVRVISHHRNLSEGSITALVKLIEDDRNSEKVRLATARVIGDQTNLSEKIITALVRLIRDEIEPLTNKIQYYAITALEKQGNLSETIIAALVRRVEDECNSEGVRASAAHAIRSQTKLSEATTAAFIRLMGDKYELKNKVVQCYAIEILGGQTALPEPVVHALVARMRDESTDESQRLHARWALNNQRELSEAVIAALLEVPEDERNADLVREVACGALESRTKLPEAAVIRLVEMMTEGTDRLARWLAELLEKQTNLSEAAIKAIIALHQQPRTRFAIASILGGNPGLSDKIAKGIKPIIESEGSGEALDLLTLLYGSFLYRGFRQQFYLHLEDDRLVIYLPSGSRIKIKVPSHELVVAAINKGRELYLPGYSDLWPECSLGSCVRPVQPSAREQRRGTQFDEFCVLCSSWRLGHCHCLPLDTPPVRLALQDDIDLGP